ncbi:MAG TPA: lytic transglycosylase domain-containing protein, partial [Polyangiaceae bacterium]|nr:lytic transglycosylase domain-containing protein [Polyangiaceae bacterium]
VAALRLGQGERALELLQGLGEQLPELRGQLAALEAECQLEHGPFEAAASYYAAQPSPAYWLRAAQAWQRAGREQEALREIERVLGANPDRSRLIRARTLRAEIAERAGMLPLAREEYRWLALSAVSPGADQAYQRLLHRPLDKHERLARADALAKRGQVDAVKRELASLKRAPGRTPKRAELQRALGRAYFRTHTQYGKAAELFEQVARSPQGTREDWFRAAEARSRQPQLARSEKLYREILRRFPRGATAERAQHLLARLYYEHGAWARADREYTRYLQRYAPANRKRTGEFAVTSRYQQALARLAGKNPASALPLLEELEQSAASQYPSSLLHHLQGVALAAGESRERRERAVARFERVLQEDPLSFAALASTARLAQLGRSVPKWAPLPREQRDGAELPPGVGLLAQMGLYSAAERELHERETDLLQQYQPHAGQVLCGQYAQLDRGYRQYALARDYSAPNVLQQLPTDANLWVWQCAYPRPFAAAVAELEARYALPSGLMHAVMRQESAFRPDARSPVGAVGLMQLMPQTAERVAGELGVEYQADRLEQAPYNLQLGAFYLRKLLDSFQQRVVLALAAYNAGPHAVSRWLEGGRNLDADLWVARIPYRETRGYVQRVTANWARYEYLADNQRAAPELTLKLPRAARVGADAY